MGILITNSGSFNNTEAFLESMQKQSMYDILQTYAEKGVSALASATPIDSGTTAASWDYTIEITKEHAKIQWINNNTHEGFNVAIGLQYGHGTRTGGYVQGRDYINSAISPIMDELESRVWANVQNA